MGGSELYLVVKTGAVAFDSAADNCTLTAKLETSSDEAFSSPTTLWQGPAWTQAQMVADTVLAQVKVPVGALQYSRLYYTTANTPSGGGTITAFLTPVVDVAQA